MNSNECRSVRQEIDQSELGRRLSESSESHVIGCASCAAFRAERTRLRELVGSLQPVTAPADFDLRLRARIAREQVQRSAPPSIFRLFMSTPAIAFAGLIVMVVGGLVWMNQRSEQPATPTASSQPAPPNPATPADTTAQAGVKENQVTPAAETPKGRDLSIEDQKLASVSRRNSTKSSSIASAPQSSDFNTSRAPSFQMSDRAGEVSLTAPVKPMVVTVYDEKGGSRKILLPPVSFGSQRWTDRTTPVSMTNTRDW
ncbi:MAG TPA: hypothetical protein VNG71_04725 [Pyrinomonadaceae bacterium]|nr:hypothetical protein [Pyrinomonadaceae bacterium]